MITAFAGSVNPFMAKLDTGFVVSENYFSSWEQDETPSTDKDKPVGIQYWLFKTEPKHYSFQSLLKKKREIWDGVKNPLALQYLRTARRGDLALIYHTGSVRAAVGIARVLGAPYPDPTLDEPKWTVVDLAPVTSLAEPVSLDDMKKQPKLQPFELFRLPRLSVVPVRRSQWMTILKMARTKL